jgi:hypothetical protein
MRTLFKILLVFAGLLVPITASAQVGSALVVVPWKPGQSVGMTNSIRFQDTTVEDSGNDIDLTRVISIGRARYDTETLGAPSFGWAYDQIELDTDDPLLPERLMNGTVAVGKGLGQSGDWDWGVTAGVGFAGDTPFADEDAWFGVGSVYARKMLDEKRFLLFVIDYDGSRVFLPDVPLPSIQYTEYIDRGTYYTLGLPFSRFHYEPDDQWTIDVTYFVPIGGQATIEYAVTDQWHAFAQYTSSTRGFHLDGDEENRRLFFAQDRAETGVRYQPTPDAELILAVGWAFEQEFSRGWDVRDDETVRELDDAAYVRVGFNLSF